MAGSGETGNCNETAVWLNVPYGYTQDRVRALARRTPFPADRTERGRAFAAPRSGPLRAGAPGDGAGGRSGTHRLGPRRSGSRRSGNRRRGLAAHGRASRDRRHGPRSGDPRGSAELRAARAAGDPRAYRRGACAHRHRRGGRRDGRRGHWHLARRRTGVRRADGARRACRMGGMAAPLVRARLARRGARAARAVGRSDRVPVLAPACARRSRTASRPRAFGARRSSSR